MISVGVRELREDLSKLLQQVREKGEVIEITLHGEAIATVVPKRRKIRSAEEVNQVIKQLDHVAAEIAAQSSDDLNSVETVREQRREL